MRIADFFIVALGLLLFYSCSNSEKSDKIVYLTEEDLPPIKTLKLEKVDLPEDYTMGNAICVIYQDSILLVVKNGDPYPLTHMLTLINMSTGEKIGEYFTRGQGPDELLSTLPRFHDNCMDIRCYVTGRLIPFNLDSAIMFGNDYKPCVLYHPDGNIGDWCSMSDTMFLTTNVFYFDGFNKCKENAKLPEFYWYSKSGKFIPDYNELDYKNIKYLTNDVSGSTISINRNRNRVLCCYKHQPYIKVFDLNLNLIRMINGPEPDDGVYAVIEDLGRLYFDTNVGNNYYYFTATSDDDNIFVMNYRSHRVDNSISVSELIKKKCEIFRFDWNGNVLGRYSARGYHIFFMNYCQNSNTLYLWVREDGEYSMYKAKLD